MQSVFGIEKTIDPNLIHKNLRCLVCQGQSISDSNSDFAQTVKLVVKDLIDEGKTEDEIYEFMSDKYGDWIVFKPQFNTQNSLLWILPYIVLIFGGFFIFSFLRPRMLQKSAKLSLLILVSVVILRFLLEFLKEPQSDFLLAYLNMGQLLSLFVVGFFVFFFKASKEN